MPFPSRLALDTIDRHHVPGMCLLPSCHMNTLPSGIRTILESQRLVVRCVKRRRHALCRLEDGAWYSLAFQWLNLQQQSCHTPAFSWEKAALVDGTDNHMVLAWLKV